MNRSTLIAGIVAGAAVVGLGGTAYAIGPRPADSAQVAPIIVYTDAPCGNPDLGGCFRHSEPRQIQLKPNATPSTIAHETMHWQLYRDGDLRYGDECYVSGILAGQGVDDWYTMTGTCNHDHNH